MPDRLPEFPSDAIRRVAIDRVMPEIDGGRFAVKRIRGDEVVVEADIVCDGHEELDCRLLVRHGDSGQWSDQRLVCDGNDRWRGSFIVDRIGPWQYTVTARVDRFGTWLRDLWLREAAGEDLAVELAVGAAIVSAAGHAAPAAAAAELDAAAVSLRGPAWAETVRSPRLRELMTLYADRRDEARIEPPRPIWVDRAKARRSSWYEVFPRSWGRQPGEHGARRPG